MLAAQQLSGSRKAVQRRQIRVFFLNSAPDSSSQADLSTRKIFHVSQDRSMVTKAEEQPARTASAPLLPSFARAANVTIGCCSG
jgi:hypothetical protein